MLLWTGGHLKITQRATPDQGAPALQKEGPVLALGLPPELGAPLLGHRATQALRLLGAHVHRVGERPSWLRRRHRLRLRRLGDGAVEEQRELAERDLVAALEWLR